MCLLLTSSTFPPTSCARQHRGVEGMFMSSACVKGRPNKIVGTPLTHLPHHNPHSPRTPPTSPHPSPTHLSSHLTTPLTYPSLLPPHHSPHPPISPAAQGQNQLGRYHLDGELKVKSDDERESRKKWVCCVRWCVLVSCPPLLAFHTALVLCNHSGGEGADQWVGVGEGWGWT